jgi:hypothetical protein
MKRTSVYADAADLAVITAAARRRGVPVAELLREGIRLAAMANRVWDEPLDWPTFDGAPCTVGDASQCRPSSAG